MRATGVTEAFSQHPCPTGPVQARTGTNETAPPRFGGAGVRSASSRSLSALHAPFPDGCVFDISEEEVLDEQSDQDDRSEAGVDLRDLQLLLVHEDEPANGARAAPDPAHQPVGEQGAPT